MESPANDPDARAAGALRRWRLHQVVREDRRKADEQASSPPPPPHATPQAPEVRTNPDGSLDEVVATNATVHLEQLSPESWWLSIEAGGVRVIVDLTAESEIFGEATRE